MEVLAVTIFISLLLAAFFVVMFLGTQRRARSLEQEALLPLDDKKHRRITAPEMTPPL